MNKSQNTTYLLIHIIIFLIGLITIVSAEQISSLVKTSNYKTLESLIIAVGTSIVATGIVGWVLFFYLQREKNENEKIERVLSSGIIDSFTGRSVHIKDEYVSRFDNSREKIDFIGFGLRSLREDQLENFPRWLSHSKIRVLLIDPTYPSKSASYSDQRDAEEINSPGSISIDVKKFLEETLEIKQRFPENFQIRLYRCLPSINYCRVDNEIFWGPYLVHEQSRNSPTFLISDQGPLFAVYANHFEKIWNDEELSRSAHSLTGKTEFSSVLS